jgi:2-polyprenyl-3-methyl-5-hydroxy-6-metoxy-1,4-benzoquinol methylase
MPTTLLERFRASAQDSLACNWAWNLVRKYPKSAEQMSQWDLFNAFWYYDVELVPGKITKGQFPSTVPLLPRMLLRNCILKGCDCLDIGSMEGLIPVLMSRQGARRVLATDFSYHAYGRLTAVKKFYGADFSFKRIDLLYDLADKIRSQRWPGFDLINVSGVLYHVFSPLHVIAGLRPLLKKNGLMIVSTNVIHRDDFSMEFNNAGKLQTEVNTFWYLSVNVFDYMLRYFQLEPIDFIYYKHQPSDSARFNKDFDSGYLSVVCRAISDKDRALGDAWMRESIRNSWEYLLCDQKIIDGQSLSNIRYRTERGTLSLHSAVQSTPALTSAPTPQDSHLLRLDDQI